MHIETTSAGRPFMAEKCDPSPIFNVILLGPREFRSSIPNWRLNVPAPQSLDLGLLL